MFVIPPPLIYSRKYNQHVEYSMLYRRFGFEYHYISHAIDLRIGADFLEHFDRTARKTCRKILREKLLRIEESDDYETFYEILLDNKARHNAKPTHSLDDLHELRRLLPGKLRLMLVYYGDIPIAGSLLFMCNSDVVLCFYNMLLYEYQHLKPIYLVMYETVRLAIAEGYRWVDIGVSQIPDSDDPMTPSLPLIDFKERFDARGILRTTYRYDLAARRAEASAT
jgi:predicted N-acyltransferase